MHSDGICNYSAASLTWSIILRFLYNLERLFRCFGVPCPLGEGFHLLCHQPQLVAMGVCGLGDVLAERMFPSYIPLGNHGEATSNSASLAFSSNDAIYSSI